MFAWRTANRQQDELARELGKSLSRTRSLRSLLRRARLWKSVRSDDKAKSIREPDTPDAELNEMPNLKSTSLRCRAYPLGCDEYAAFRAANIQVARCVMLIAFLSVRGLLWILDQPLNSWLRLHPLCQCIVSNFLVYEYNFPMWKFGSRTKKPTRICCNFKCIEDLANYGYVRNPPDILQQTCEKCIT